MRRYQKAQSRKYYQEYHAYGDKLKLILIKLAYIVEKICMSDVFEIDSRGKEISSILLEYSEHICIRDFSGISI